ncbi:MAG TPA: putative porin [Verrucomicrobiae bacterium]|jgi:polyhydroxyalkanoate synthesis regulator phasin|nr:putative porin [Verrucomicrobiae bacterium]
MMAKRIISTILAGASLTGAAIAQNSTDALLDKLVQKGILSGQEAQDLKSENLTNSAPPAPQGLQWKITHALKNIELFGDLRFRYEYRSAQFGSGLATYPAADYAGTKSVNLSDAHDSLDRFRYALRFGARGDLTDDIYFGLRFETSPNPRSPWNTFGNSSGSSAPYQGPFSKANNYGIFIGQAYLGWKPADWVDVSLGRIAQPLYTTPMVWDSDYCPEGAVEKFSYKVGKADLFATFGQFIYQDTSPGNGSQVIGVVGEGNSSTGMGVGNNAPWLLAWQVGVNYHISTNMSFKVAPAIYNYTGRGNATAGFFGPFVGQGTSFGLNYVNLTSSSSTVPGISGKPNPVIPAPATAAGNTYINGYNQTGINDLLIMEIPAELNFKLGSLPARVFGDFSVNWNGDQRARAAYAAGEADYPFEALQTPTGLGQPNPFPNGPVLGQDKAWQIGLAVGTSPDLTYGRVARKNTWEARVYWQRIEQYALDPNLIDSDFFEGRGNMEGIYAAFAYSFTDAMIATLRYGRAERVDKSLGSGGFNADLPLPNPITKYDLVQLDLTLKF